MKVLVTGAMGGIGYTLFTQLTERGYDVCGTDIALRREPPSQFKVADLRDRFVCYELMQGVDALLHFGGHSREGGPDQQAILNENVVMTNNLCQAGLELGMTKMIYASSIQAMIPRRYGSPDGEMPPSRLAYLPLDSDYVATPGNAYGLSKALCENIMKYAGDVRGIAAVALRLPHVFDPKYAHYYSGYLRHSYVRRSMSGVLDECFAYLSRNDLVALCDRLLQKDMSGYHCYFAAAPRPMTSTSVAELREIYYPDVPLNVAEDELTSLVDCSKLKDELDWEPVHDVVAELLQERP